jgi:HEAT repeat protein
MIRFSRDRNRKRSLQWLVRLAVRGWGSDASWAAIAALQWRGNSQTLGRVRALVASPNWRQRAVGIGVASQLLQRHRRSMSPGAEYALEETQAMLLAGLRDRRDEVVAVAATGFSHRPHPAALPDLVALSRHPDASMRFHVTLALGRYTQPDAIAALLRLARDDDAAVRDWATFGLGTLHDVDSPDVRQLLWDNLHDEDEDVRGEALAGLAQRRDPRVIAHLIETLDDDCRVYELDAAETMADPALLEPLRAVARRVDRNASDRYWLSTLDAALAACGNGPDAETAATRRREPVE